MDPVPCTEKVSAELKSSFRIGIETEDFVAQYLIQKKFKIVEQRLKTPFGEVDLLLRSPRQKLIMIEVKSLSNWDWISNRLGRRQRQRLLRTRTFLENKYQQEVILKVAYVGPEKKMVFLDT